MPESHFANRTNEVVWINASNNWILGYYKNVNSDILEEMFVTTESRGYNKISEYDTHIHYSMEILYRTRAVEDNSVKKKHGILLGFEPWSTPTLRDIFIEFLKDQGARAGT